MANESKRKLKRTLQDVRKMRRSMKLRKSSDPEVVGKTLETILHEAIVLRASGTQTLGKGAVNELRNIRRAMVAGQIDAGQSTGDYIARYSGILEQIDNVEKDTKTGMKEKTKGAAKESILKNLPSSDSMIAALTAANPVLGYGAKIAKDLGGSLMSKKREAKQQEAERIKALEKEGSEIEDKLEEGQDMDQRTRSGLEDRLDRIHEELKNLNLSLGGNAQKLEAVNDNIEDGNRLEKMSLEDAERSKTESKFEKGGIKVGNVEGEDAGGFNTELLEKMEDMGGGTNFVPIGAFGGKGGMLRKFLRGTGIGALLGTAAFSAGDGATNTADILDKDPDDVTWRDRMMVGGANPVGDLANLTEDYFLKPLFGIDSGMDSDGFTKAYAGMVNDLDQALRDFFTDPIGESKKMLEAIDQSKWLNDVRMSVTDGMEWTVNTFKDIKDVVVGVAETAWDSQVMTDMRAGLSSAYEATKNRFNEIADSTKSWLQSQYNEHIKGTWREDAFKSIEEAHDNAVKWTTNAMERLGNFVDNVFGKDGEESESDASIQDRRMSGDTGKLGEWDDDISKSSLSESVVRTMEGYESSKPSKGNNVNIDASNNTVVNGGGGGSASFAPPQPDKGVLDRDSSFQDFMRMNHISAVGGR